MSIALGDLEILIDGISIYSYKTEGKLLSDDDLLDLIVEARSNFLRRETL